MCDFTLQVQPVMYALYNMALYFSCRTLGTCTIRHCLWAVLAITSIKLCLGRAKELISHAGNVPGITQDVQ